MLQWKMINYDNKAVTRSRNEVNKRSHSANMQFQMTRDRENKDVVECMEYISYFYAEEKFRWLDLVKNSTIKK